MANFGTLNTEGVSLSTTYTPYNQAVAASTTNSPDNPGPPFTVGTKVIGSNGSEYVFVLAGSAITQFQAVSLDANFNAVPLTTALGLQLLPIAFATQTAIANAAYGWVQITGEGMSVLCRANTTKLTALYTSTSAGVVSSVSSSVLIAGLILTTSGSTTSRTAKAAIASWPRAVT